MYTLNFRAMGCAMRAMVVAESPAAQAALEQVPQWFAEWEKALSRFDPTSELSRLNAAPGQWHMASPVLWDVLQAAQRAVTLSEGWVRPDLLSALEAAGYRNSFETLTTPVIWPGVVTATPWQALEWDASQRAVRLPTGMRLDVGGIAKGWCADVAAQRLSEHGPALVDAGGDIALNGAPDPGWPIALARPTLLPAGEAVQLCLGPGGVATSGRDHRRWRTTSGSEQHHLIDPHTQRPAFTDVLTTTVIAANAYEAEIAAKAALLQGSIMGLRWLTERDLPGAMFLADGTLHTTSDFDGYEWR